MFPSTVRNFLRVRGRPSACCWCLVWVMCCQTLGAHGRVHLSPLPGFARGSRGIQHGIMAARAWTSRRRWPPSACRAALWGESHFTKQQLQRVWFEQNPNFQGWSPQAHIGNPPEGLSQGILLGRFLAKEIARPKPPVVIHYVCHVLLICTCWFTPSPPIKSLDSRGFDTNKLLILRSGNYHIHMIV